MPALPTMQYSKLTKTSNDVAVYYNLGVGMVKKRMYNGGFMTDPACGGSSVCPAGSFDATVLTSVTADDQPVFGSFPANSPIGTAFEGEVAPNADGVFANLVCLPNPANDVLICFDGGVEANLGQTYRAVPRKYNPADHWVPQRAENTLRISDLFVSNWAGVERIRGRRVTIIVKVFVPGGSGAPTEIQYYSNAMLNVPTMNSGNDGNANIEIQGEGNFSIYAVFAALAP